MKRLKTRLLSLLLTATTLLPLFSAIPANADPIPTEETTVESRKTPLMGWASWNAYRTNISEDVILSQANKLLELGLADLGYRYVNVDDGWQSGRGSDGSYVTYGNADWCVAGFINEVTAR